MKVNYQALLAKKDPNPSLERWRGGEATLWHYTVSHRVLEIRVGLVAKPGHLSVYCGDVQYLRGPTKWSDSELEFVVIGPDEVVLRDQRANFEIHAALLGVDETSE